MERIKDALSVSNQSINYGDALPILVNKNISQTEEHSEIASRNEATSRRSAHSNNRAFGIKKRSIQKGLSELKTINVINSTVVPSP